jgi:hypothetical protein
MTMNEVEALIAELPEVEETTKWHRRTWVVRGKSFAWERPLGKTDTQRLRDAGADVPQDPILAVATDGLEEKEAVLAAGTRGVFTIQHFNGYPAVLIELRVVPKRAAKELIVDGWLAAAPNALADAYMTRRKKAPKR